MIEPLRCAVLSMAHVHAARYASALRQLPETRLVAIWDDDAARGRAIADDHGVPFTDSLDALLARADLDAVVITAENTRHRLLCEAACAAGKHVLCEKPLATTQDDAEAMIAAAERAGVVLATAFPVRHNPPARAVKETLWSGSLGRTLVVRATNRGQLPPGWFQDPARSGGGAIMDHTVHVVDLLRWYLQDEPVAVYAETGDGLYGLPVEDVAFLTITFQSGLVATLDPSWSRPLSYPTWGDVTMEIACARGTVQLDAFAQTLAYYPGQEARAEWLDAGGDDNAAMLADFARAVREGRRAAADGRDGERALAVVLAAYASARSGQPAPVAGPYPSTA